MHDSVQEEVVVKKNFFFCSFAAFLVMHKTSLAEIQADKRAHDAKTVYGETHMNVQYHKSSIEQDSVVENVDGGTHSLDNGRQRVIIFKLPNGLTLLVRPTRTAPVVSIQLW